MVASHRQAPSRRVDCRGPERLKGFLGIPVGESGADGCRPGCAWLTHGNHLMPISVLIVDDHKLAREAIRTALGFCKRGPPNVVGEALDATTALTMARRLLPDAITLDISIPDGLDLMRELQAIRPTSQIVVVTMHKEREYREAAAETGAVAYVTKDRLIKDLPGQIDRLETRRAK